MIIKSLYINLRIIKKEWREEYLVKEKFSFSSGTKVTFEKWANFF